MISVSADIIHFESLDLYYIRSSIRSLCKSLSSLYFLFKYFLSIRRVFFIQLVF